MGKRGLYTKVKDLFEEGEILAGNKSCGSGNSGSLFR